MQVLTYRNQLLTIIPGIRNGSQVYWIQVNGVNVLSATNPATAKRLAAGFVDTVLDAKPPKKRFAFRIGLR